MRCKGRDKDLALYVAGDLDAARIASLKEHLYRCPACQASELALRKNMEALRELAGVRLEQQVEERFHRQVVAFLHTGDTAAPTHFSWLNHRAAMPLALAACALAVIAAGTAYLLMNEARPAIGPMERLQIEAQHATKPYPIVPPASPTIAGVTPSKAASPTLTSPTKVQSQIAKRAIRTKETPPHKEEEALVIRLQTDDPDVVIYWQLQNRGG